jgi:hypothetical protein
LESLCVIVGAASIADFINDISIAGIYFEALSDFEYLISNMYDIFVEPLVSKPGLLMRVTFMYILDCGPKGA